MSQFLVPLDGSKPPPSIGHKAESLFWLRQQGWSVPQSFGVRWEAYDFWRTAGHLPPELEAELAEVLNPNGRYAVRSSANVEDNPEHSFAGQFSSYLNIMGIPALLEAIEAVFASTHSNSVETYLGVIGMDATELHMGVVIQAMVVPLFSGVAFSKNPLTGLDEVIIELVEGSGEQLVQAGVTPERWVYKWGDWTEKPRRSPVSHELAAQIVANTEAIAAQYGEPVDLEWIFDGTEMYWVQVRPITSLQDLNIYSNRISREVLPGIIHPLVWSINVPMINSAWIDLFTEMIGPNDIAPSDLSQAFHYRAYFNMGPIGQVFRALGMPKETLELMMGLEGGDKKPTFRPSSRVMRHLPRLLRFAWNKLRFHHKIEDFLPIMRERYIDFAAVDVDKLEPQALLEEIDALFAFTRRAAYFNIVAPILQQAYNGMFNRRLAQIDIDPARFDITSGLTELAATDPTIELATLAESYRGLPEPVQQKIRSSDFRTFLEMEGIDSFKQRVMAFLTNFGHMSDSGNDFSRVPWRENPELVRDMIVDYVASENGDERLTWETLPKRPFRLRRLYKQARRYRLYREQISATYTYGYGLFRNRFIALGRYFVAQGLLEQADDIFYLFLDEVKGWFTTPPSPVEAATLITQRAQEMDAVQDVVLPEIIYGDTPPPLETLVDNDLAAARKLHGIPTSRGYYQGPVRVIHGVSEFGKMEAGDVLVIPFSDVSWSPLFSKAGAVIAESGGMLSHSSIVAREYNLPAVVSVSAACNRLQDGEIVAVDGFTGEILRQNGEGLVTSDE